MNDRVTVELHHTPEHSVANDALKDISVRLTRLSVLISLTGAEHSNEDAGICYRVVGSHLLSGIGTLSAILNLTDALSLHVKDATALARVFYETLLVASFTANDCHTRAEQAALYAVYKRFRTQTRVQKAGGWVMKVSQEPRISRGDPLVKRAIEKFGESSKVRPCFTESRDEMISDIGSKSATAGLLFAGVEGMIHDISSEIIHGSYYGYEQFNGPNLDHEDEVKNLMAKYEAIFFSICLSTAAFAKVLQATLISSEFVADLEKTCMDALLPFAPKEMREELLRTMQE